MKGFVRRWRLGLLAMTAAAGAGVEAGRRLTWSGPTRSSERRSADMANATSTGVGPSIERVRELSSLTTVRVEVADAIVTELHGRTGGTKVVLIVRGEVAVGVDLSAARFVSVDAGEHRGVLVLPWPTTQSVGLDHDRTRLVGVWEGGLWAVTPGGQDADVATVNAAYAEAQRRLAQVAADKGVIDRARRQAELVLRTFVESLGWTVEVRWSDGQRDGR